jgi:hypothetical protein
VTEKEEFKTDAWVSEFVMSSNWVSF